MIWTSGYLHWEDQFSEITSPVMTPTEAVRRRFPEPSIAVFLGLQALDVLTTMLGLRVGAKETSVFVGQLLNLGALEGLLISKCFAVILAAAALGFHRPRVVVFLNYWFVLVITWNLGTILWCMARV
jgi:hypothetical protein